MPADKNSIKGRFNRFSSWVTKATGSSAAFFIALLIVVVWALTGPIFGFSEVWQLVINTGTTIITFLMMFVIQQSQNKDTMALHLKLNELIAANDSTSNRLLDSEDLTEEELEVIKKYYRKLSSASQRRGALFSTHSLDEAEKDAQNKAEKEEDEKDAREEEEETKSTN